MTEYFVLIFKIAINFLNRSFTICGFNVTLWGFILFDIIAVLLLKVVFSLFNIK